MNVSERLFDLLDQLDKGGTVVASVRQPAALREAVRVAVEAGMDASVNDANVNALRDRLEMFAQGLALEEHFGRHPRARPSLLDVALAAAEQDGDPLADEPELLARAADEVAELRTDPDADDVLLYAAALRSSSSSAAS